MPFDRYVVKASRNTTTNMKNKKCRMLLGLTQCQHEKTVPLGPSGTELHVDLCAWCDLKRTILLLKTRAHVIFGWIEIPHAVRHQIAWSFFLKRSSIFCQTPIDSTSSLKLELEGGGGEGGKRSPKRRPRYLARGWYSGKEVNMFLFMDTWTYGLDQRAKRYTVGNHFPSMIKLNSSFYLDAGMVRDRRCRGRRLVGREGRRQLELLIQKWSNKGMVGSIGWMLFLIGARESLQKNNWNSGKLWKSDTSNLSLLGWSTEMSDTTSQGTNTTHSLSLLTGFGAAEGASASGDPLRLSRPAPPGSACTLGASLPRWTGQDGTRCDGGPTIDRVTRRSKDLRAAFQHSTSLDTSQSDWIQQSVISSQQ